ncbi:DUF397 domain-containing protein [Streptomyces sp. H27-H5]|uniref:DUF397 domain-containing protein n=1 Tax=Streptomyces sp. H27-H5 TaxID=2996460 RepID=UPI002271DCD1|nr:DUF397 domain-containing protein [Streptomyces sp. H27-H5]MCY0963186.1 DUF397 domain-containing protein [Streptomyces sp. H27-H5]
MGAPHTKPNPAELDFSTISWEKSPFSGDNDNCVEFGAVGDLVIIRDSNRPEQTPCAGRLAHLRRPH